MNKITTEHMPVNETKKNTRTFFFMKISVGKPKLSIIVHLPYSFEDGTVISESQKNYSGIS